MFRWIQTTGIASLLLLLAACGSPNLDDHRGAGPKIDLEAYFAGATVDAWGQFQDRFGKVRRSFYVEIRGTMEGDTLVLNEDFTYNDGEKELRIWRIRKTGPDTWEGEAEGVVGKAAGVRAGNALNWSYDFDLPFDRDTVQVHFDDWLWQQPDPRVVINRAYVSKLGINLGEVFITFVKRDPA